MTNWNREAIRAVSRIRAVRRVSRLALERAHDPEKYTADARNSLTRALQRGVARITGLHIDPCDTRVEVTRDPDSPDTIALQAWWEPATTRAEIHGGAHDGEQLTLAYPREDVTLTRPENTQQLFTADHDAHPSPIDTVDTRYTRVGWNPDTRRWIYVPA